VHTSSDPGARSASHTEGPVDVAPRGGLRALCNPAVLTGGLKELAWVGAHVLLYPLGTRAEAVLADPRNRPGDQPPAARALFSADPLAARTPVLLVHGLIDNRSIFTVMRRGLRRRGFTHVCSWNYSPLLTDVSRGARDLGRHVEWICEQTGHDRVHVVGHSLGGLLARYYIQRLGGDRRVQSLVTLGTPRTSTLRVLRSGCSQRPDAVGSTTWSRSL
jgi:triacylglycerol esterase/lipase EstA (alpha/beta hydrolase family)